MIKTALLLSLLCIPPSYASSIAMQDRANDLDRCQKLAAQKTIPCLDALDRKQPNVKTLYNLLNCDIAWRDRLNNCIDTHLRGESL